MLAQGHRTCLYALIGLLAITGVAADAVDDFSTSLFSALSPLLELLGEGPTVQFMSESMGWADNIILAMAPLGILTIISGAVRVGGPSWLKALAGRARDNSAAAEVELMSSTSNNISELWNGRGIVRSVRGPPVVEFICLLPEDESVEQPPTRLSKVREYLVSLWHKIRDAMATAKISDIETQCPSGAHTRDNKPTLRKPQIPIIELKKMDDVFNYSGVTSKTADLSESIEASEKSQSNEVPPPKIYITWNPDNGSPNISLNINNQSSTFERIFAAIIGTVLQLGVLVYAGLTTYYPSYKLTQDDNSVASYAYPCTAAGTVLLIFGVVLCAEVVESNTVEKSFEPKNKGRRMRVLWLQQQRTGRDQTFKSCIMYAKGDQTSFKSSRRHERNINAQERNHHTVLVVKTVIGTTVTLAGFLLQFIGLQSLHWSTSFAQVGAAFVMVLFKAFIRRRLARPPKAKDLAPGFELDWLAKSLGRDDWPDYGHWGGNNPNKDVSCDWRIVGDGMTMSVEDLKGTIDVADTRAPRSRAHKIFVARRKLGCLAGWSGIAYQEASCLAKAIEATMTALFELREEPWEWQLPVICDGSQQMVSLRLNQDSGSWRVNREEIDAVLSLWLSSLHEDQKYKNLRDDSAQHNPRVSVGHACRCSQKREDKEARLEMSTALHAKLPLGLYTPDLERDLEWWVPRNLIRPFKLESDSQEILRAGSFRVDAYTDGNIRHKKSHLQEGKLLATDFYGSLKVMCAQELFSYFMEAAARKLQGSVFVGVDELHPEMADGDKEWTRLKLRNNKLSQMVQDIHATGLGTLGEIYARVVTPLSRQQKLPEIDKVVEWARERAEEYARSENWERTEEALEWLSQVAETPSTVVRAQGILMDHLRRAILNIEFREGQKYDEEVDTLEQLRQKIQQLRDTLTEKLRQYLKDYDNTDLIRLFDYGACDKQQTLLPFGMLSNTQDGDPRHCDQDMCSRSMRFPEIFNVTERHYEALRDSACCSGGHRDLGAESERQEQVMNDVNARDILGRTPAHYAGGFIRSLKESGADLDAQDLLHWTPLHYACWTGNTGAIETLIRNGVDVDYKARDGSTSLHYAASQGSIEGVRMLVEAGALIDVRDYQGNAPIHLAAYRGLSQIVSILLENGSRGIRDRFGRTALHQAALSGKTEVIDALLITATTRSSRGNILLEDKDRDGQTPLSLAARMGHLDCVETFLNKDVNVNSKDRRKKTPLHWAAELGHSSCVETLLKNGADVESKDERKKTPLHWAAESGRLSCVEKLLDNGADVEPIEKSGLTPLHFAAQSGNLDVVLALIEKKGEVDLVAHETGWTPLMMAAQSGHTHILKKLVEKGADTMLKDRRRRTALHHAAKANRPGAVKMLVELGCNIEEFEEDGMTPLMTAVRLDSFEAARQLLESGAEVNMRGYYGETALSIAMRRKSERMIALLRGAEAS